MGKKRKTRAGRGTRAVFSRFREISPSGPTRRGKDRSLRAP